MKLSPMMKGGAMPVLVPIEKNELAQVFSSIWKPMKSIGATLHVGADVLPN